MTRLFWSIKRTLRGTVFIDLCQKIGPDFRGGKRGKSVYAAIHSEEREKKK